MSFSVKVKSELSKYETDNLCCHTAECYGLLLFARKFSENRITVVTENEDVAKRVKELCRTVFSICPKTEKRKGKATGEEAFTLSIENEDAERIFSFFGHDAMQISLRINNDVIMSDCCGRAFLRGVFLSAGSITDPEKAYHCEIVTTYLRLSQDIFRTLGRYGLSPKTAERNSKHIIYFKSSEEIEDFLGIIGAPASSFDLMEIKIIKDVRNRINRMNNCDSYNISRSIETGLQQAERIRRIIDSKGLSYFPAEYRELARLRAENPEASLKELGELLSEPISKSGVSHRMKRIMEYTE